MRFALLCIALAGCAGQLPPNPQFDTQTPNVSQPLARYTLSSTARPQQKQIADSAYVRLLEDLPLVGRLLYNEVTTDRTTEVRRQIGNVEINRCMLSYDEWTNDGTLLRIAASSEPIRKLRGSGGMSLLMHYQVAIPLNAIDASTFSVRLKHAVNGLHFDPPVSLLHFALLPQTSARIEFTNVASKQKAMLTDFEIEIGNREDAALLQSWLRDGATRCEGWSMTPTSDDR